MNKPTHSNPAIVPRQPAFDFEDPGIPRHWYGSDPFLTRFIDGISVLLPVGEKFVMRCARDFMAQASPALQQDIKGFMRQEGQHSMLHGRDTQRLRRQGIDTDAILALNEKVLFKFFRKRLPPAFTMGMASAFEHLTSIMAESFVSRPEVFSAVDARMRAFYVWHLMEEIEHRAVCFDVFTQAARGGYALRVVTGLLVFAIFPLAAFGNMNRMFKVDGFGLWRRMGLWARGMGALFGRRGLLRPLGGALLAYLKPGFHPWQLPVPASYGAWLARYQETGDARLAGDVILLAG